MNYRSEEDVEEGRPEGLWLVSLISYTFFLGLLTKFYRANNISRFIPYSRYGCQKRLRWRKENLNQPEALNSWFPSSMWAVRDSPSTSVTK
jgi:hypothetical protein